jgi:hypothetical protein
VVAAVPVIIAETTRHVARTFLIILKEGGARLAALERGVLITLEDSDSGDVVE